MDPIHVLVLALLQGVAELFPISSLGHTVILPGLLGWNETLQSPQFLPLVVMLHLGTAVALLTFYWRDWVKLLRGGVRVVVAGKFTPDVDPDGYGRQLALVVVGTIPAGLVGVLFQKTLQANFSIPILAAALLVANGAVLLTVERLWQAQRRKATAAKVQFAGIGGGYDVTAKRGLPPGEVGKTIDDVTFGQALLVGFAQVGALFPGFSRSGLTMAAGMGIGLSHEAAARLAFLMATPVILGAALIELPQFAGAPNEFGIALIGGVVAGVAAFLSVRFLTRYLETRRLDIFAYYCVIAGLLAFGYFFLKSMHILP
ncbi:MAG TPA: undecaprenyl-diphosphate phosphatase [Ktedonobacterales bacterium]|nr:undecaprenyl-diphosphate phosphatase [Ktedonobacterales bacterium]